ncbi:hypothetical protein IFR05_012728 [Cadophora sp. M221]|nr:hypothetical protein IFR05_012728 [Cadophora sp. M221]
MKESARREASVIKQVLQLSNYYRSILYSFVVLVERPTPRLILEYLPLGNLDDQHKQQLFSDQESLTILCQSLDALTSVHQDGVVHRDIKPENILVQSRNPLHLKFTDFGLSKATADLKTFCGTHRYFAPEIYTTRRVIYYTKACDIWSLGVVVFEYAYGPLPKSSSIGLRWCEKIIRQVNDWDSDDLVDFLAAAMLIIEPDSRLPARECWKQALQLSAPSQSRCLTPTQASYPVSVLQDASDPYSAMPSASPTEVATFIARECIEGRDLVQGTNTASSQAVDHYLIDCGTEEPEPED